MRKAGGSGRKSGKPLWNADISVFINCPYDAEYLPLFDSIFLTTVACGFVPRSAIESGTVSLPRMERICDALFSSRYSIHDLSRCRGQGDANLARFNMPLELGMAMSRTLLAKREQDSHDWLVLVPKAHEYMKYASDLGAFDPKTHESTIDTIVPPVVNWLKTRPNAPVTPFPDQVLAQTAPFLQELTSLRARSGGELPWSDTMLTARKYAALMPV